MSKFDQLSSRFAGGNPPDLVTKIVAGAAANTNIAVVDLNPDDILVGVVGFGGTFTGAPHTHTENTAATYTQNATTGAATETGTVAITATNHTAAATIPATDTLRIAADTTGQQLMITYWELR